MPSGNSTPQLIAGADILPFSVVKIATGLGDFVVVPCQNEYDAICGVTDGSVSEANGIYHAKTGQPVTLQAGKSVILRTVPAECPIGSETYRQSVVTRGAPVFPIYEGQGAMARNVWQDNCPQLEPLTSNYRFIALESAASSFGTPEEIDSSVLFWAQVVQDHNLFVTG